jgi:hypothetical protein
MMAMRAGVTTSVIAHASLLIVALAGLSAAKPITPETVDSISVDLVPISEITNVRSGSLTSKVVKADAPAIVETPKPAELAKPTGNTEQDQIKPEETSKVTPAPTVNTAPEPKPAPDPTPVPDPPKDPMPPIPEPVTAPVVAPTPAPPEPQKEIATDTADTPADNVAPMPAARPPQLQAAAVKAPPKDTKPVETPKPTPTPVKPAAVKTPPSDKAAKLADQVAELINSEKSRGAVTGDGGQATLGKNTGKASVLSQSVIDMLSAAMLKCFNPPIAAIEEGATALLEVRLSRGGFVEGSPQVVSTTGQTTGMMTGTAAVRAVLNCGQAGYTMLPPDMYDGDNGWNTVRVTFNASDAG